ncbi:hypothetical protein [Nesterenkonia massiliensis]|uniref:hypothetical protein n=1 Tax=Nesterenkonia massiliensis TaxID=1232429 RepID=UPI0005C99566|nr:hypothetical protein [Nesterenkonia massiliensis]
MRSTPLLPVVGAIGVIVLATSCSAFASTADSEQTSTPSESATAQVSGGEHSPDNESSAVPVVEAQLAEGMTLPECVEDKIDVFVDADSVFTEDDLLHLCPAEPAEDRVFRPSQQIFGDGQKINIVHLDGEAGAGVEVHHLRCDDADSLAHKAAHNAGGQPVGWPQEWNGQGVMPDPYCHPDYLEIGEWEHLEAFASVWEGIETSTLAEAGQPQDEINQFLWQQSQARAAWTP